MIRTNRLRPASPVLLVLTIAAHSLAVGPAAAQPTGACCSPTGTCIVTTQQICEDGGRIYLGDGTDCDPNPCPMSTGACCFPDDTCQDGLGISECAQGGGVYQGDGSVCSGIDCPPLGACCLDGDLCTIAVRADCLNGDGEYLGDGTTCSPDPCVPPTGAPRRSTPSDRVLLTGPFPNPASGRTTYRLELPTRSRVRIRIVDVTGRLVSEPVVRELPGGAYTFAWDPFGDGSASPNGIYFLHVETETSRDTRKIVLAR